MSQIYVYDYIELDANAEDMAMLMALNSRSHSISDNVNKVNVSDSGKFTGKYYIGYGHDSIGDCGNTNIFLEDVSMIAAKTIEDNQLFNGQESSTRYIDFSQKPIIDPIKNKISKKIMNDYINFYKYSKEELVEYLYKKHNIKDKTNKDIKKTIDARAFDILRGFLPLGSTTNLGWNATLKQAKDQIISMRHNPVNEVRDLSNNILNILTEKYPNSFNFKIDEISEEFYFINSVSENFFICDSFNDFYNPYKHKKISKKFVDYMINFNKLNSGKNKEILNSRPRKVKVPKYFKKYGTLNIRFMIDYGSFRDIQRHRAFYSKIPLVNNFEMHNWYMDNLSPDLRKEAESLLEKNKNRINTLKEMTSEFNLQYYYPMGTLVPVEITTDIPQLIYVTELRSSRSVHPTLRQIAFFFNSILTQILPDTNIYVDNFLVNELNLKRGSQDIKEKKAN